MVNVIKACVFVIGCTFRGTQSAVEDHKGSCSCSSELHIQTVTMAEVLLCGFQCCIYDVCLQLKQLKSAHTDLEQQLSTVQKQYQLLHKDNEKLLSIVTEQAKYEIYCIVYFVSLVFPLV